MGWRVIRRRMPKWSPRFAPSPSVQAARGRSPVGGRCVFRAAASRNMGAQSALARDQLPSRQRCSPKTDSRDLSDGADRLCCGSRSRAKGTFEAASVARARNSVGAASDGGRIPISRREPALPAEASLAGRLTVHEVSNHPHDVLPRGHDEPSLPRGDQSRRQRAQRGTTREDEAIASAAANSDHRR